MNSKILQMLELEMERAKKLHSAGDTIGGIMAVGEEFGEVMTAWNEYVENKIDVTECRKQIATEALHVAVTAIRLVEHVKGI